MSLLEQVPLGGIDAVLEGGIDHNRADVVGVLIEEGTHTFVELSKARRASTFGRDVRAIDDNVSWG